MLRSVLFDPFQEMERLSAVATVASLPERTTTVACGFVSWYEVFVSSDRGRREVHYYLKRGDGSSDLAVVGKEKSLRHMSYHYALQNRFLNSVGLFSSLTKLKSRREVVEWLSSVVSGTTASLFLSLISGISITEFLVSSHLLLHLIFVFEFLSSVLGFVFSF